MTVNPPHGDLVLSVVSICASPNLDVLGGNFDSRLTFEPCPRYCLPCLSKNLHFEVGEACLCGYSVLFRCYYAFVLPIIVYCSLMWGSAAECHLRLLE